MRQLLSGAKIHAASAPTHRPLDVAIAPMPRRPRVVNNPVANALTRRPLRVANNPVANAPTHRPLDAANNPVASARRKAAAPRAAMPPQAARRAAKKAALVRRRAVRLLPPRHAAARPKARATMSMRTMKARMARNTLENAGTASAATAVASRWRSSTACWTFWRKSAAPAACSTRFRPSLPSACTPSALNAAWVRPQVSSQAKARMALAATNARKAPALVMSTKALKA